jgi:hypothetical protein
MNPPFSDERAEREWAVSHLPEYLLGRLDIDQTERLGTAVALLPGLLEDVEEAEEELIEQYLDDHLSSEDRVHFERQYVNGDDLENQDKLRLHQALRSSELRRELEPAPPLPVRLTRPRMLTLVAAAACLVAVVFAALYHHESRRLGEALAALKRRPAPVQRGPQGPPGGLPGGGDFEQPAGIEPDGGLVLPAALSGSTTVRVAGQPARLIWPGVPDYRKQYRIRIDAASGEEKTSALLTPRDNAIAFSPGQTEKMPLPWDVFVLTANDAGAKILAHYLLVKP